MVDIHTILTDSLELLDEARDQVDSVEEADAAEMEHCGGKNVIFSATGFYCTKCKKRVK